MKRINNKNKREKICELQNNRCHYCNIKLGDGKYNKATLDHIQPFCKVGNNTEYVVSCSRCNRLKGDISYEEYKSGFICVNFKIGWDIPSINNPIKVRKPISFLQKTFPSVFPWNKFYTLVIHDYETNYMRIYG